MPPLASRIRPESLADFVGQKHLVGEDKPLREAILKKFIFSFILWGPPGVGKTTLARIYAKALDLSFYELSAVSAGKADIKKILEVETEKPKVLFLDEIHRFNKAQQDFLLPFVEKGDLVLIGATTENPSFEVVSALLSRCQVFILKELTEEELELILKRTKLKLDTATKNFLIKIANGDARLMLTILEETFTLYKKVTPETLEKVIESSPLRYDKTGEGHFDTISAFIKSMRASRPDAALYYLAKMIAGGEDLKFIARRMIIFASEDIGMAQPTALVVANEVFRAVEIIGYPECAINLAHGVVYLATAKKDRSSYEAFRQAEKDIKNFGNLPIPLFLRNAPTKLMKEVGYSEGYEMYPNDDISFFPKKLEKRKYL